MKRILFFLLLCIEIGEALSQRLPYDDFPNIPIKKEFQLSNKLDESSGLIFYDNLLWSHNDDTKNNIYAFSTRKKNIKKTIILKNTTNTDWEDIAQDSLYIYVGDFGNNAKGNRNDLKIYRFPKSAIRESRKSTVYCDTISFYYPEQTDFSQSKPNRTNFDCEAMIVMHDSIYLFTKEWLSRHTTCYVLPAKPGNYPARKIDTFNMNALVTGADYDAENNRIFLCGYRPRKSDLRGGYSFVGCLIENVSTANPFKGDIHLFTYQPTEIPYNIIQMEAVAFGNDDTIYFTSESFKKKKWPFFKFISPNNLWSIENTLHSITTHGNPDNATQ